MESLVLNMEAVGLERRLSVARGAARLPMLVESAWHLRQRDSRQALAHADEAGALCAGLELPQAQRSCIGARLDLVRGEAKRLFAELDAAELMGNLALRRFAGIGDHAGCADAHWLLAGIASCRGQFGQRDRELMRAADRARHAGDMLRLNLAQAAHARCDAMQDHVAASAEWGAKFPPDNDAVHPALRVWMADFHATTAFGSGDYVAAIHHYLRMYELAQATGQIERGNVAAASLSAAFAHLDDLKSAMEWATFGLVNARTTGWPGCLGRGLMQMAMHACHLGRPGDARDMLSEAIDVLAPLCNSPDFAMALRHMGDLKMARKEHAEALRIFRQYEERLLALHAPAALTVARRRQAEALCELGRVEEALQSAHAALALAIEHGSRPCEMEALELLAGIHARYPLAAPAGIAEPSVPLHYLGRALDVAATIDDFNVPARLFDSMASEYAKIGDTVQAYATLLQSVAARDRARDTEAVNRAMAAQIKHQTERARAEAAHHRQLAEAEARRAEALEHMNTALERLSAIGQEITTHLDVTVVIETLSRHVCGLLDAPHFAVYLLNAEGDALDCVFGIEDGKPLPAIRVSLQHSDANVARCARQRCEIRLEQPVAGRDPNLIPGTWQSGSALFAPLSVGKRLLGVMSVQSPHAHAYAERERLIFRTLCAYGAIALDNASAYRQLKASMQSLSDAQQQLVLKEKMASLGILTAGVAHEINNPANFSHAGAQVLADELAQFRDFLLALSDDDTDPELMNILNARMAQMTARIDTIIEGTTRIKVLVQDLRMFSRLDQAEKKPVPIADNVASTVTLVHTQYADIARIRCDLAANPVLECWPAQLNQVFMNLIVNACQAIQERQRRTGSGVPGLLHIRSRIDGGNLLIEFEDSGCGMPDNILARIFEPFFTTKKVGEGTGLGLSISFGIIEKHHGDIRVTSTEGNGSCFTVVLPLTSPQRPASGKVQFASSM
jgi:signal transduction histidine kinase